MFNKEKYAKQRAALRKAIDLYNEANLATSNRNAENKIATAKQLLNENFPEANDLYRRFGWYYIGFHSPLRAVVECSNCGMELPSNLMLQDEHSEYTCPECAVSAFEVYWPARSVTRNEPIHFEEDEDDEYSEDDEDRDPGARHLQSCGTSPISYLGKAFVANPGEKITAKTRFFGIECEFVTSSASRHRDIIAGVSNVAILKEDGSLPYGGAELCSLPITRDAAYIQFKAVCEVLQRNEARAWNRPQCGLHIHVSRDSASWLTWGKVDRFFENRDNSKFLDFVSGRESNSYCERPGLNNLKRHRIEMAKSKAVFGANRYQAINFSTNKPTVEFRLFRGNTSYDGIMRCIEFCDSLIEFARASSANSDMNAIEYTIWLKANRGLWPNICKYISKGILPSDINLAA